MNYDITNLIAQFANYFDMKDWQRLKAILADYVDCDYKDLRGKSGIYSSADYIQARKEASEHLKTHHLFSNFIITIQQNYAYCRCSAIIYRQNNEGKRFDSHVFYDFELMQNQGWKIHKIKQSVLWNEGDPSIHSGVSSTE